MAVELMNGSNRLSSRRKLINDRYIQIAIKRHCQSPRYGSRGHDQNMRRLYAFCPQTGTLGYAETVLLVDDNQSQ